MPLSHACSFEANMRVTKWKFLSGVHFLTGSHCKLRPNTSQVDFLNMSMVNGVGRSYKYYTGTPLFPFGFGLSFTEFDLRWATPPVARATVRCAVFDRNLHSRIPLRITPLLRLKLLHACDQWHSARMFTTSYRFKL
jgi:hypothetical protein